MPTIHLDAKDLPDALRRHLEADRAQMVAATFDVCHRGQAFAVALTNGKKLVDRGLYKMGFRVAPIPGTVVTGSLRNDTPYANVIEWGRRPKRPGPPYAPILGWVMRKLGLKDEEAKRAAFAIRRAIHNRGLKPHHIMRQTKAQMEIWFRADVERRLATRK